MKHRIWTYRGSLTTAAMTGALALALSAGLASPSFASAHKGQARSAHHERAYAHVAHHDRAHPSYGSEGTGIASVYSGGRTASGQRMDSGSMTAAHRSLPFGTMVTVVNHHNGRSVVVRINDRGPFVNGRVIDLSPAAGRAIGVSGLAPVSLRVGRGG